MNDTKWNLQMFGEGDGAEGDVAGTNEQTKTEDKEVGFDDFLKDPKNQAEFDRRLSKAMETQKSKLDVTYKDEIAKAKAEAEELAKMNAEQKQQYEIEKLQKENAELRKAQAMVELRKSATEILQEEKIDATQQILDLVVAGDAETTKANIDRLVSIINDQIKAAEIKRATGTTPKSYGGNGNTALTKEEIMKIKDSSERQKAIAQNVELFQGGN